MTEPDGSRYDIEDPAKIQGRDEIAIGDHNLAELRLARALEAIGERDGRLLLLGSGAGRYARALAAARPDLDVIAGDLSHAAVSEAMAIGGPPAYLVMNAQQLPFLDASFSAVIFFDLLEHVPDPPEMIAECRRVLTTGGVLHFFVPLEDEPGTLYRALRDGRRIPIHRWKEDHVGHIQRFQQADVLQLVWTAGFTVISVKHSFHLIGQIHDIVDYWQRERTSGGRGRLPLPLVRLATRGVFLVTWRLAYLEDRLYDGGKLASGLHVTAILERYTGSA